MSFMEWSEDYAVGVPSIDRQHQQFFMFINALHEALHKGEGADVIRQTIEDLADYAAFHFLAEETLLKQIHYSMFLNHSSEHADFTHKIQEFRDKHHAGNFMLALPVMDFMKNWLASHILESDKKYGKFLHDNHITFEQ